MGSALYYLRRASSGHDPYEIIEDLRSFGVQVARGYVDADDIWDSLFDTGRWRVL